MMEKSKTLGGIARGKRTIKPRLIREDARYKCSLIPHIRQPIINLFVFKISFDISITHRYIDTLRDRFGVNIRCSNPQGLISTVMYK